LECVGVEIVVIKPTAEPKSQTTTIIKILWQCRKRKVDELSAHLLLPWPTQYRLACVLACVTR